MHHIPLRKRFRLFIIPLLAFCLADGAVFAQGPSKSGDTGADYSKEAFVIEQDSTNLAFENDGTSHRESTTRIRIQSDSGVQRYGVLTFPYDNPNESLDIAYVRVTKPDGTVISSPADNIQDLAAEISRAAPFYADLREKHVPVKGLGVGDVLEFQAHWRVTTPVVPGKFWFALNFAHDAIILQQQLKVSAPHDQAVKWKSPDVKPVVSEESGRRIFTWTSSQLEPKSSEREKSEQDTRMYQAVRGQLPPPDVQLSNFQSWDEIGRWYDGLQKERVKPTAEVRVKAAELTKNTDDEEAKIRAIYSYVSTQFRYIGVAFGIGRYQPHSAAEVLTNQYGDCKDKHTLLASLLDAAGIKAYPALISSGREVDPDFPSPGQFDHVISVVPRGNGFLWLDTTPEVSPFAYLITPLRNKPALVIFEDKPSALVNTPADPPSMGSQTFQIKAKLSNTGTLEGKIERTAQGDDSEVVLRSAFRRVPLPQWKDLIQAISYGSGFAGDVSDVVAGSPEKTNEPFHFAYSYTRKDFPNWSERQISSPLPRLALPSYELKPSHPVWLGAPEDVHFESQLEIPKGYTLKLPKAVHLKSDFADFDAVYVINDGTLTADRHLVIKRREVPVNNYDDYEKFRKAVDNDYNSFARLSSANSSAPSSYQDEIWLLPYSDNQDAANAYDDAKEQYAKNDTQAEIASLKRALEIDPKFVRAWLWLGEIYKYLRQFDPALQAYRKAIDIDPTQSVSYKALASTLFGMKKYEDALPVLRDLVRVAPDDADGLSALGTAFFVLKRYKEAVSAFESAVKLSPQPAAVLLHLGYAYLRTGEDDKALATYQAALALDAGPLALNDIAYQLADANKKLPIALEYSQKAVREEEEVSQKVKLSELKIEDLNHTASLASFWDTLGWVLFRMGDLDKAEKYLKAAWILSQNDTIGDHLGQVYEAHHKTDFAVHIYQLALAASQDANLLQETQSRLQHLGDTRQTLRIVAAGGQELSNLRTTKLGPGISSATAEFFILFGPGARVEDTKFISGSESLKSASTILRSARFDLPFPDEGPTRLLRRGILACSQYSGCSIVLMNPSDVHSVN